MKVAILGGSFNPIHNGHLEMSQKVLEEKISDQVWIMPCKKHALDKALDKEEDRVAMIKLALRGIECLEFSDFELKREGKNYTYQTMRALKQNYSHDFSWIIGSDILKQIPKWYGYDNLQKEVDFIVLEREGYPLFNPGIKIKSSVECNTRNISSTQIRDRIRNKKPILDLVPREVGEYILNSRLYLK